MMLAVPIARPPQGLESTAMLVTRIDAAHGREDRQVTGGIAVELRNGSLHSRAADPEERASTWALGRPDAWLDVAVDGTLGQLQFGGAKPQLAKELARSFHEALQVAGS